MALYKCPKCGAEADSKCAASRNVFQANQYDAIWSWFFHANVKREECKSPDNGGKDRCTLTVDLTLTYPSEMSDLDLADAMLREVHNYIEKMIETPGRDCDPPTIQQFLCHHEWKLQAETCELGCCRRVK